MENLSNEHKHNVINIIEVESKVKRLNFFPEIEDKITSVQFSRKPPSMKTLDSLVLQPLEVSMRKRLKDDKESTVGISHQIKEDSVNSPETDDKIKSVQFRRLPSMKTLDSLVLQPLELSMRKRLKGDRESIGSISHQIKEDSVNSFKCKLTASSEDIRMRVCNFASKEGRDCMKSLTRRLLDIRLKNDKILQLDNQMKDAKIKLLIRKNDLLKHEKEYDSKLNTFVKYSRERRERNDKVQADNEANIKLLKCLEFKRKQVISGMDSSEKMARKFILMKNVLCKLATFKVHTSDLILKEVALEEDRLEISQSDSFFGRKPEAKKKLFADKRVSSMLCHSQQHGEIDERVFSVEYLKHIKKLNGVLLSELTFGDVSEFNSCISVLDASNRETLDYLSITTEHYALSRNEEIKKFLNSRTSYYEAQQLIVESEKEAAEKSNLKNVYGESFEEAMEDPTLMHLNKIFGYDLSDFVLYDRRRQKKENVRVNVKNLLELLTEELKTVFAKISRRYSFTLTEDEIDQNLNILKYLSSLVLDKFREFSGHRIKNADIRVKMDQFLLRVSCKAIKKQPNIRSNSDFSDFSDSIFFKPKKITITN